MANVLRLTAATQDSLVSYAKVILDLHKRMSEYRGKMEFIDIAYARYNIAKRDDGSIPEAGVDYNAANAPCGINVNDITVPIVISQVDSYVGYFSDVFLSGFPMFPVVSTFESRESAEMLESVIDDHSVRGRYPRHLMMSFRDSAKYNFSATEIDWAPLDIYNIADAYDQVAKGGSKVKAESFHINKLNRWDPYNTIWDYRVHPVDVPYVGEYAGHIDIISRVQLKRELAYFAASGDGYNTSQGMASSLGKQGEVSGFGYYTEKPQISSLIQNKDLHRLGLFDWVSYLGGQKQSGKGSQLSKMSDVYEKLTLYVRIIPQEHGMDNVPNKGSPQVWKLCFINHEKLVYAKKVYSLYDMIPVFFTQPFEDGFGMQTKSLAENSIPFQTAASDLFSIRLNSARRAISDRAIYDPVMLNSSDINAPFPAPKIPLRDGNTLSGKKIGDAYHQIPFDSRGTETVIQDMGQVVGMADKMHGINQPIQGQFQKGNKTRKEWDDTMEAGKNRMRLPALAIEYQQMLPIKEQIKLNIYQYGVDGIFQDQTNGKAYEINAAKLADIRKKVGSFKIADGFTPAERVASTDVLVEGMKFISQSPLLQQSLGPMLPQMFVHFMSLGGVKALEQYLPPPQPAPAQNIQQPPGAPGAPPTPSSANVSATGAGA